MSNKQPKVYLRPPATSNMELFGTLFNGFQPLANVTKSSISDVV